MSTLLDDVVRSACRGVERFSRCLRRAPLAQVPVLAGGHHADVALESVALALMQLRLFGRRDLGARTDRLIGA